MDLSFQNAPHVKGRYRIESVSDPSDSSIRIQVLFDGKPLCQSEKLPRNYTKEDVMAVTVSLRASISEHVAATERAMRAIKTPATTYIGKPPAT